MKIIPDISHYQAINWSKFKPEILIAKCTESTNYFDPTYTKNKDESKKRGIPFISYHFARQGDPKKEAAYFLSKAGDCDGYALDAETGQTAAWCKTFVEELKNTGKHIIIYTPQSLDTSGIEAIKWIPRYKFPGWDARDDGKPDFDYQPKKEWDIWQYTSNGTMEGVSGRVDLNVVKDEIFDLLKGVTNNDEPMTEKLKKAAKKLGFDFGEKLNDSEMDKLGEKVSELYDENVVLKVNAEKKSDYDQLVLNNKRLLENNGELSAKLEETKKELEGFKTASIDSVKSTATCELELRTCKENLKSTTEKENGGLAEGTQKSYNQVLSKSMQKAYSFDKETVMKIGKGALIAGGGALAVYILQFVAGMDFGEATPIVVAVCGILINAVREWVKGA